MTTLSESELAQPARLWLARGQQALQADKRDEALAAFRQAVASDPHHIDSLLWLAGFCEDPHESLLYLTRVLELDAHNEAAHEGIRWARKRLSERAVRPDRKPGAAVHHAVSLRIVGSAVISLLLLFSLGGSEDWFWKQSVPAAVASAPVADTSLSFSAPLADIAADVSSPVVGLPDQVQRDALYQVRYAQGVELRRQNDLQGALKAYQAAVDLDGNAIEARSELAEVKADLGRAAGLSAPESSAALAARGAKWIDVNLTTQRFRALRGQTTVYSFVTSTGLPSMRTQPGRYKVLDKIPNAYSRIWKLKMPYWMGIYWVSGTVENGIHALPINLKGQTLWGGLLGHRASFGCVILDTQAAKTVFNWADIGTPVIIHN
jgi:lipoprotein-anchoring transpeptidase ErfK/SrfK